MLLNFKHYINQENILPEKEVEIISNEFEVKEIKKGSLLLQAERFVKIPFLLKKDYYEPILLILTERNISFSLHQRVGWSLIEVVCILKNLLNCISMPLKTLKL